MSNFSFRAALVAAVFAIAAVPTTAIAAGATAPAAGSQIARENLKRFADGVRSFEAHFEQEQTDDHGEVTGRSAGHFWLLRPGASSSETVGRFRWAYEQPYEQLTVCDGDKLWAYDPDLEQVTVRDARRALLGTPAALLSQKSALADAFDLQDAGKDGDLRVVRLLPKNRDSDFKSIELALNGEGAPVRMRFADQIGGHSEVRFRDIRVNAAIDPSQFRFTPPKGVEVVDGDAAQGPKSK